jgi:hypothetical protein
VEREQTPSEHVRYLLSLLVFGRRPTGIHLLWMVRVAALLGALVLVGHAYSITLWDWLDLLIIPVTIAVATTAGAAWFTRQSEQDAALQTYLDKMSELLVDKELHEDADPYGDARVTARARTLAVLRQIGGRRKRTVLLFLREARLINKQEGSPTGRKIYARVIGLRDADLTKADLRDAKLINTLRDEPISLKGANLEMADLEGADLREAKLVNVDLAHANLTAADLSFADLTGATVSQEQLAACVSLEGTTLPDGSKHG